MGKLNFHMAKSTRKEKEEGGGEKGNRKEGEEQGVIVSVGVKIKSPSTAITEQSPEKS